MKEMIKYSYTIFIVDMNDNKRFRDFVNDVFILRWNFVRLLFFVINI